MSSSNNTNHQAKLAVSKSLLKEYHTSNSPRTVYMADGTEFQIQLFNPESTEIACRVFINDEELSNMIVLRPGERLWLERYTDKAKKFLFRTYDVCSNNAQVQEAIKNNGVIRVQFYRKKSMHYIPTYYYPQTIYPQTAPRYDHVWGGCPGSSVSNIYSTAYSNACSKDTEFTSSVSCCLRACDTVETGRITEGSHSGQSFETVDMMFESWSYQTETFKILPVSQKPVHREDLVKRYCPMCGRKVVEKYKFCPYCGNAL